MRKKLGYVCVALALVLAVGGVLVSRCMENAKLREVSSMKELCQMTYSNYRVTGSADRMQYDYKGLWDYSHTIALVTPVDELTTENSHGISETGDRFYNAHSIRTIKVLQFFKNTREYTDQIKIAEACAMLEDGTVVAMESCYPMQKDGVYLVFLGDSGLRYPLVISADNGKFDLTHLRLNAAHRQPLIVEALMDLELLPTTRSRNEALEYFPTAEFLTYSDYEEEYRTVYEAHQWQSMELRTDDTHPAMALTLEYVQTDGGYLYHVGDMIFSSKAE